MKTTVFSLITAIAVCFSQLSFGAKFRVNNNPGVNAPYTTLTAAYSAAASGDTIYVEGSATNYGDIGLYKAIVIIGTGYYLSQNPETQVNKNSSYLGTLYPQTSNIRLIGLVLNGINVSSNIGNLTVSRCSINYINWGTNYSNVTIEQNIINGMDVGANPNFYNSTFRNNYIGSSSYGTLTSSTSTLLITQNVFSAVSMTNSIVTNNIIVGNSSFNNCYTSNNICTGTQVPAANGNQLSVDMNNVFVCWSNCTGFSNDGRYQLKTGSVALGAGANGEDCGMYGGNYPYQLSGMPPIPSIYYFNYNFNNSAINVDLKMKSHN